MSHLHTQIRNAFASKLAGLASTGARVYPNQLYALDPARLPALRIYADQESVQTDTVNRPPVQTRRLQVVVECCAKASADLDDACDQMQLEVEQALYTGITVGSRTLYPELIGGAYDDAIGLTPVCVKRMSFVLDYYTLANAPDSLA